MSHARTKGVLKVMHEASLIKDLIHKIETLAAQQQADVVTGVHVWLGALSHMSKSHFADHFGQASAGTIADGARLTIDVSGDFHDRNAQAVLLRSIEVEL